MKTAMIRMAFLCRRNGSEIVSYEDDIESFVSLLSGDIISIVYLFLLLLTCQYRVQRCKVIRSVAIFVPFNFMKYFMKF